MSDLRKAKGMSIAKEHKIKEVKGGHLHKIVDRR